MFGTVGGYYWKFFGPLSYIACVVESQPAADQTFRFLQRQVDIYIYICIYIYNLVEKCHAG